MKIPQLRKKPEYKTCHNITWEDDFSWVHQKNILEVLKDPSKLDTEVKKYLEEENAYAEFHLKNTKEIQKKLFDEIKGRIKLEDESIPFKDQKYYYWTKTTKEGNYSKKLRKTAKPRSPKTIEGTAARLLMFTSIKEVNLFFGAKLSKYNAAITPSGNEIIKHTIMLYNDPTIAAATPANSGSLESPLEKSVQLNLVSKFPSASNFSNQPIC